MYHYSKKSIYSTCLFIALLLIVGYFVNTDVIYRVGIGIIILLMVRDVFREKDASFDLLGDKLLIKSKDKVVKTVNFKDVQYITITRKNKRWTVIANDKGILFTVKPKIENYEEMVSKLLNLTKSNNKIEVHDYIKKTYLNK